MEKSKQQQVISGNILTAKGTDIMKLSDVLTCPEAAELWDITEDKIKRYAREGKFTEIEARKAGKNWLITRQGMERVFGNAMNNPA